MNPAIETEVIEPSNAIALRPSMSVGQALGVDEIVAQVKLIQDVMHKVMKENEHYGTIPGCGSKKTLLQPGAQKLTMTFRLCPEYQIQETHLDRGHKEYRVICTLKSMGSGAFVGQGVGCCSSMEGKYRWRGGSRKCPECGKETIIKGKAEYGGGWLCFQKKGGCGHKWPDGAPEIEGQSIERIENDNPADTFNTVLKMAKKRAFVDATITATAASDIFTQDLGDDGEPEDSGYVEQPKKPTTTAPKFTKSNLPEQPKDAPKAKSERLQATQEQKAKFIALVEAEGSEAVQKMIGYYIEIGALLPNESLKDIPLRWCPASTGQLRELTVLVAKLNDNGIKERPSWYQATTEPTNPAAAFNPEEGEENPFNAPEPTKAAPQQPELTPQRTPKDDEAWRDAIVPIPHKGQKRADYLKNPDTIGSLFDARHDDEDARKRLFGFVSHFEPKPWTGNDGKQRPPSKSDIDFRKALDDFADWHESNPD